MRLAQMTLVTMLTLSCVAQTNHPPVDNFALVTNLWYQGYKTNVLAIAEQRLAANSNDLAGLIVQFNFDLEFTNRANYSNDIARITNALHISPYCSLTNGPLFVPATILNNSLTGFLEYLASSQAELSQEEERSEKQKSLFSKKPLADEFFLKKLSDYGLF